jgi:hypothetical protein
VSRERSRANWRSVIAAAARLAGLYAIGVVLLVIPLVLLPRGALTAFRDLAIVAVPAGLLFLVAFPLLAAARRAGFAALWLLLAGLWVLLLVAHDMPIELLIGFVAWSALAFPLHVLGALGVPSGFGLRIARVTVRVAPTVTIVWMTLLIAAVTILYTTPFLLDPLSRHSAVLAAGSIAPFVWGPAPLIFATLSLGHVWAGTARRIATSPAA